MIDDVAGLILPADAPADVGAPPAERDVTGNEVLTEGGTSLGQVRDVVVVVGSKGEVVGYEIETASGQTGYIPLPAQWAVSGSAIVVPEATKEFVKDDLVGLGAAVDEFRSRLDPE
jgi:sporulation protein YlmC with PRC-barrel domain